MLLGVVGFLADKGTHGFFQFRVVDAVLKVAYGIDKEPLPGGEAGGECAQQQGF